MSIPVRTVAALLMVWTAVACRAPERAPSPIPADARVERLATGMEFTEGPVWLADRQVLVFSDTRAGRLMQWREGGGLSVYREEADPNGNALDPRGRLLTCRHRARDVVREEDDGSLTVVCDRFDGRRFNSPNDLAVQRDGTVWFTDPPWGLPRQREGRELPGHWVFRVDPGGAVEAVLTDRAMPNGIALSADERTLYVADTGGHPSHPDPSFRDRPATVTAYALRPDGTLAPEPRWRIDTLCDGMCLDAQGNLHTTGRAAVNVWRPDGSPLGSIPIPENPTNVCFGGPDHRTLFITARTSLYAVDEWGTTPFVHHAAR